MSLSEDWRTIQNAAKDRRGLRKLVGRIVKQNRKEQQSERILNSSISALMNIFSVVRSKGEDSALDIDGMVIAPETLNNPRLKGTEKDPRVIIRMAQEDPEFNQAFKVETSTDEKGNEQYIIRRRKVNDLFS